MGGEHGEVSVRYWGAGDGGCFCGCIRRNKPNPQCRMYTWKFPLINRSMICNLHTRLNLSPLPTLLPNRNPHPRNPIFSLCPLPIPQLHHIPFLALPKPPLDSPRCTFYSKYPHIFISAPWRNIKLSQRLLVAMVGFILADEDDVRAFF